jgi:acyl-CoA synthetase (AMP-forming)/AMP-acid ligase II/aryl carrier-like protein
MQIDCLGRKLNSKENLSNKGITFVGDDEDRFISYSSLYRTSLKVLSSIQKKGVSKGDELIVYIEDEEEYIYAIWACVLGGITAIPLLVSNNEENLERILKIWNVLDKPYIITSENLLEKIGDIAGNCSMIDVYEDLKVNCAFIKECIKEENYGNECVCDVKDTALIMFSSGSTGEPKGIILSHENIVNAIEAARNHLEIKDNDVFLNWMPLTHAIGLNFFHILPLAMGVNQVIIDRKLFVKNPSIWLQKASDYKATILISPNVGFEQFLKSFDKNAKVDWNLSSIHSFMGSAEPLSEDLLNNFLDVLEKFNLRKSAMKNLYGMTESVLGISLTQVDQGMNFVKLDRNKLMIRDKVRYVEEGAVFAISGTPLNSLEVRVCDNDENVLESETIGNIQVKGTNMTSGYYKNDVENEKLYTKDGWLRTNDVGFIKDGAVIITGRTKDIIILNGQNLYAHDIERIAYKANISEVEKIAACGVFDNKLHGEKLMLFVKYDDSIDKFISLANKLKGIISKNMNVKVESVIPVKEMPETASGKVQRKVLINNYINDEYEEIIEKIKQKEKENNDYNSVKLDNRTNIIKEICEDVLAINDISIDDDLFELGLHSISIIKIQSKIKEKLNCEIEISDFINNSTINLLSQLIDKNVSAKKITYPSLVSNKEDLYESFPLTEVQMAYEMGRDENLEGGGVCTHFYHEIKIKYDINKLNKCLNRIIQYYPMMRAVFSKDGKQKILKDPLNYEIINEDISFLENEEQRKIILEERARMSHQVFEIDKWPLFEFKSYKISSEENYLFVSFDLLIADAASILNIGKLLVDMYNYDNYVLPDIDFTFRDYMLGYNELKNLEVYRNDKKYWLDKIDNFSPAPILPYRIDPSELNKPTYKRLSYTIDMDTWRKLKILARKNKITPSALLCTAYAKTMAFWSNQENLALNLTAFNRYPFHKDVDLIFGDFTSVIPLDISIKSNKETDFFMEAKAVQKVIMESLEHRHYDGVEFIRDLSMNNKLEIGKAVMPIVFSSLLFDNGRYAWSELGSIEMAVSQTPQVFIDNQVMEYDGVLSMTWDYVDELFDEEVINGMFGQYIEVLNNVAEGRDDFSLSISDKDKEFIERFNDTFVEREEKTLHGMFKKKAKEVPDNIAVSFEEESITYRELNEKSNKLANYLIKHDILRNEYVGAIASRKIETIINILGILKAGGAYIPMEPSYPEERIEYIVKNSNAKIVLDERSYKDLNIDSESMELIRESEYADDIAYVIYTSGSTGKPKGVVIKHSAAANTIEDINGKFNIGEGDKVIGLSSMCFDLSVYDIFGALSSGAELVLIEDQKDVKNIARVMKEKGITVWNSVPAIMDIFIENTFDDEEDEDDYWESGSDVEIDIESTGNLKVVLLSGDWIPLTLPEKIKSRFLNAEVVGLGGATEASIWSNYFIVKDVEENWSSIPYGYPLENQKFYVLNYDKKLCPVGVMGE